MSFLDQLNPQQREAVETTEGPVLILAGAGSGKTRVITYRIAYLIEHKGVRPESILAMTFTNKAAAEMGERVEKLVGGLSIAKPVISTFHSFCVRMLRRDIEAMRIPSTVPGQLPIGHTKNFVIYDESDQQSLVKSIIKRLGLDDKELTPRTVLGRISWAKNHMVAIKIGAILVFLVVGGALVNPSNWKPFAPSGFGGIVTGGAIVFFTYIGFDSVSTAAEESRNPQRDLPFGIIASLIVCTVLYVGVSVVLLGMMKYTTFVSGEAAEAPVAYALKMLGASRWSRSIIVVGALMGMISSLLVFQYGQARIWYAMSRDGLFPRLFSAVHSQFKTPHISTWIAGFVVGVPSGIFAISDAADLSNIGTLFAFALVSLGVIILRRTQPDRPRVFRVPMVPWFPLISIVLCVGLMAGLTIITWVRFVVWLVLGLLIYALYSRRHSEFARKQA